MKLCAYQQKSWNSFYPSKCLTIIHATYTNLEHFTEKRKQKSHEIFCQLLLSFCMNWGVIIKSDTCEYATKPYCSWLNEVFGRILQPCTKERWKIAIVIVLLIFSNEFSWHFQNSILRHFLKSVQQLVSKIKEKRVLVL